MKLSNWSVVLATSIIVDPNSTSEDVSNYFSVSQNDGKLENLGFGPPGNKSGKTFSNELQIMSSSIDLIDPGRVGVMVTSWDIWGTQPGVFHVSLGLNISWSHGENQLWMPSMLRTVRHFCCHKCLINHKSQSYRLLEISP